MWAKWKKVVQWMWSSHRVVSIIILVLLGLFFGLAAYKGLWLVCTALFGGAGSAVAPVLIDQIGKDIDRRQKDDDKRVEHEEIIKVIHEQKEEMKDAQRKEEAKAIREADQEISVVMDGDRDHRNSEFDRLAEEFISNEKEK